MVRLWKSFFYWHSQNMSFWAAKKLFTVCIVPIQFLTSRILKLECYCQILTMQIQKNWVFITNIFLYTCIHVYVYFVYYYTCHSLMTSHRILVQLSILCSVPNHSYKKTMSVNPLSDISWISINFNKSSQVFFSITEI